MAIENWDGLGGNVDRTVDGVDSSILTSNLPAITEIADEVVDILKDGWQFGDVIDFFEVIGPLMELVEDVSDLDEATKDQFVADAVYLIYQTVDTYPDGEQNNIDIPFVFGGIERGLEKRLVDFASRAAIKALRSYIAKKA